MRRYYYSLATMKVHTEKEMEKGKLTRCRYEYLGSFKTRFEAELFADLHGFDVIFHKKGER